jgi:hypothetical protein
LAKLLSGWNILYSRNVNCWISKVIASSLSSISDPRFSHLTNMFVFF